ncbi:hypothetical protein, partial [Microvirga sp. KLBC 81]|uniref:hypothetical protein n=1 Tax=Microvirga sp. KLBC 81 TaxID=1862707 RepID=UPI00197C4D87
MSHSIISKFAQDFDVRLFRGAQDFALTAFCASDAIGLRGAIRRLRVGSALLVASLAILQVAMRALTRRVRDRWLAGHCLGKLMA